MRRPPRDLWPGVALGLGAFAIYTFTLLPGVPPTDGGELILAAWLPGVAHAPGFPLYSMVGWLGAHMLPAGSVAWRLNLLSAASGGVAVGLAYALALRSLRRPFAPKSGRTRAPGSGAASQRLAPASALDLRRSAPQGEGRRVSRLHQADTALEKAPSPPKSGTGGSARSAAPGAAGDPVIAAAVAAGVFGLGRAVWTWSTSAEVYTLTLALIVAVLLLALRSGDRARSEGGRAGGWEAWAAGALFGLGLGGHLTSMALMAPAAALLMAGGERRWQRLAAAGVAAAIAGAIVYAYLPLRAASSPLLNWGDPDSVQRFLWHVTAKQYRVSLFSAPVWPQARLAAGIWWFGLTPPGIALALLGGWCMAQERRRVFVALGLVVLLVTPYAWAYVIEDDQDAYYLPALLAGSVWLAWGARSALTWVTGRGLRAWAVSALALLPVLALAMNWQACNRRADTISEDYARDALREVAPDALILGRDWQFHAPALYLQVVEGVRPDVTVVDTELMRRGWYFDLLHRIDPALMAAVAEEEARFLALRADWEKGEIPPGDPRNGDLQAAYTGLLDAMLGQAEAAGRPLYIGPNRGAGPFRNGTLQGQPDVEEGVGARWRWDPAGLTFRGSAPDAPPPAQSPPAWRLEAFDHVQPGAPGLKIRATRADMAVASGLAAARSGDLVTAEAAWRLALALEADHLPAAELLRQLGKSP